MQYNLLKRRLEHLRKTASKTSIKASVRSTPLSLAAIWVFFFLFLHYKICFGQYSKSDLLVLLHKLIFRKVHMQVSKFLVVANTTQFCLINSKKIFIILIWQNLHMFRFFTSFPLSDNKWDIG